MRDRVHIKAVMRAHGASAACMSGSGPSVFALVDTDDRAQEIAAVMKEMNRETFALRTVTERRKDNDDDQL